MKTLLAGVFCLAVSAASMPAMAAAKAPLPEVKPGLVRVALPVAKPEPAAKAKVKTPEAAAPGQIPQKTTKVSGQPLIQQAAATSFTPAPAPEIRKPTPQQSRSQRWTCVKYVQAYGSVALRGDGWQWWDNAAGHYDRGQTPKQGAIMVLKRTGHLRSGHVAIVSKVIDKRTVLVDHANWGWSRETKGKVHLGMKVVDVSPKNDWSQTRFWFEPGNTLGSRTYPTYGFVYAPRATRPALPETRGVRG